MCKACQSSIGKMKKTRKTSANGIIMQTAAISAGLLAGAMVVPKVLDQVDKEGKLDPNLVNGGVAAIGVFGAMKTKGHVQNVCIGLAAGSALKLVANIAGITMNGIGNEYYNNSYGLDYVAEGNPYKIPSSAAV